MSIVAPRALLVPVTESAASLEAVAIACAFARARKGTVDIVHVVEVPHSQSLEVRAEEAEKRGDLVLRRAEEVAAQSDFRVVGDLLRAREAGQAIIDEAYDLGSDVIVLGIARRPNSTYDPGRFSIGATASYILEHAHCQVWLIQQAPGQERAPDEHPHPPGGER